MNLTQLNNFAKDFNINPDKFGFYGFHDVVLLDFAENSNLPDPETWEDDNEAERLADKYGVYWLSEYNSWGFFT